MGGTLWAESWRQVVVFIDFDYGILGHFNGFQLLWKQKQAADQENIVI